jgi:predicted metal-binding protein
MWVGVSLYLPYVNISLLPTFIIMICKICNIKITKENTKKVSGGWRYKSKCLKCYQEDSKRRHKERYKRLKESRWF